MAVTTRPSATAVHAARDVRIVVGRLRRRFRETYDRRELTPSQLSLMTRLDRDGRCTASELATAEGVRPQSVSVSIGVLEERGFVSRKPDPDDGRRQLVGLTRGGRAMLESSRAAGEQWLARALDERLSAAERDVVVEAMRLLDRVTAR